MAVSLAKVANNRELRKSLGITGVSETAEGGVLGPTYVSLDSLILTSGFPPFHPPLYHRAVRTSQLVIDPGH